MSEEDIVLIKEATAPLKEAVTAMDERLVAADALIEYFAVNSYSGSIHNVRFVIGHSNLNA